MWRNFLENSQDVAPQVDIARSIKMPPMPGQSRSLLQIKQVCYFLFLQNYDVFILILL